MKIIDWEENHGVIEIRTPYSPEFVAIARQLNGNWNNIFWSFRSEDRDTLSDLLIETYGMDGRTPVKTVTVRATIKEGIAWETFRGPLMIFGRVVGSAFGRDSGARLGTGVAIVSGRFTSGGSVKNWKTVIPGKTTFDIHDVPEAFAKEFCSNTEKWPIAFASAEIRPDTSEIMGKL